MGSNQGNTVYDFTLQRLSLSTQAPADMERSKICKANLLKMHKAGQLQTRIHHKFQL